MKRCAKLLKIKLSPFLTKEAQCYIACFEALAQLALAMTAKAHHGHSRMSICLPTESDSAPTEGGINKLFTTSWPLSEFLGLIASWSSAKGSKSPMWQEHTTNGPTTSAGVASRPLPIAHRTDSGCRYRSWPRQHPKPPGRLGHKPRLSTLTPTSQPMTERKTAAPAC